MPGVFWKAQFGDSKEPRRLGLFIKRARVATPAVRLDGMVKASRPDLSARLRAFVSGALVHLADRMSPARVKDLARQQRVSVRTVEREARNLNLPSPKHLLDWVTLLYVHEIAEWSGTPYTAVAADFGLSGDRMYELRRRLLPTTLRATRPYPAFAAIFEEFRRRVGARGSHPPVIARYHSDDCTLPAPLPSGHGTSFEAVHPATARKSRPA